MIPDINLPAILAVPVESLKQYLAAPTGTKGNITLSILDNLFSHITTPLSAEELNSLMTALASNMALFPQGTLIFKIIPEPENHTFTRISITVISSEEGLDKRLIH